MLRALAVALALVPAAACRSTSPLEVRKLPVHLAVVPVQEPAVGKVAPGELEGTDTELGLQLDADTVSREVVRAMEEYCFARVTLLDPVEPLDAADPRRDATLVALAEEAGADWIAELSLRYDREVYRENAGIFWLNFPLFLFAAPSNWFLPDVAYSADVELTARIYDLHAMEALSGSLGEPLAEVISVGCRFDGVQLAFVQRSRGLADYAKGLLIPSGFLARDSESVVEALGTDIVDELGVQLVKGLQSRLDRLVRNEPMSPVYVDPAEVAIVREGSDLVVHGRALLQAGGVAARIGAVHLDAGSGRVTARPGERGEEGPSGYRAFPFEARVRAAEGSRYLRIECEAGARDVYVRSYTFPIPDSSPGAGSER